MLLDLVIRFSDRHGHMVFYFVRFTSVHIIKFENLKMFITFDIIIPFLEIITDEMVRNSVTDMNVKDFPVIIHNNKIMINLNIQL